MTDTIDLGTSIVSAPEIRGGRPHIAGTGVTVKRIAGWHKQGMTPEEIADAFGHLTLEQVRAALAYYRLNREAIDADLREEEEEAVKLAEQYRGVSSFS